jgi:hypothetical protein
VNDPTQQPSTAAKGDAADASQQSQRLHIRIYQLAGDEMFRGNRADGSGWAWSWAPWQRDWMERTPKKYAYRCLPLTIANQTGWWVYNPIGFTADWNGQPDSGNVKFAFDADPQVWSAWVNNQFGQGIITWNTPFLFRTQPAGSRLLVCGPINSFKHGIQPLTAIIESDWMSMSFTMNWKITAAATSVRFERGEPLFQVIPMARNLGGDLESAHVTFMRLADDPEVFNAYEQWKNGRFKFHDQKRAGAVRPDEWQKDYFQGRDALGQDFVAGHQTKLTPPEIEYRGTKP